MQFHINLFFNVYLVKLILSCFNDVRDHRLLCCRMAVRIDVTYSANALQQNSMNINEPAHEKTNSFGF